MVRENITAFIIPTSSCYYLVNSKNSFETNTNSASSDNKLYSSIELADCKSVVIRAGDILQIDGEIHMQHTLGPVKKLIKCLVKRRLKLSHTTAEARQQDPTESGGKLTEVLYLPEDTQGRYSPVARIENISGVHKLVDLVKKFRFPVTVQLVYGRAPPVQDTVNSSFSSDDSSHSSNSYSACHNRFSPILKLLKIYEEENLFAYPVGKESCLIQLPTHTKMSMLKANNMGYLIENSSYLRSILTECKSLAPEYSDMINCLPKPPPQSILDGLDNLNTGIIQSCVKSLVGRAVLFENNSECDVKDASNSMLQQQQHKKKLACSDPESNSNSCNMNNIIGSNLLLNANNNNNNNSRKSDCITIETEDENRAYDEIDRLYEYVRTGILPVEPKPASIKQEKLVKLKKSGSLLKLCQTNTTEPQSSLPQPIRIKITNLNNIDNLQTKNLFLKKQQSITHLVTAGLTKTSGVKDEIRMRKKSIKETPPLPANKIINYNNNSSLSTNQQHINNSNVSINQMNDDETSKELIDYYCPKITSSQIKRSASLNKLDSFPSSVIKSSHNKLLNNLPRHHHHHHHHNNLSNQTQISSGKTTQLSSKKQSTPKLVFPIVKHTKKVNFSGVNQYQVNQQVLPPPPVIAKNSSKSSVKPIELKLSDLTELANIKAIVTQNLTKTNDTPATTTAAATKQNSSSSGLKSKNNSALSTKLPFNIYNSNSNNMENDQTYKTDCSTRQTNYSMEMKSKSHNLRKSEFFDSLQTLNDYDLSSSNNMPTTSSNNNNNNNNNNNSSVSRKSNNMYHSFAADDLLLSTTDDDENFGYGGEENENYYLQKSQFAPFGNAKSSLDIRGSSEKLNGASKKKAKIYTRNDYNANSKPHQHQAMNMNNVNITHGLRNYSSMEKLQIIRLQKY